jgi:hypothetical protein
MEALKSCDFAGSLIGCWPLFKSPVRLALKKEDLINPRVLTKPKLVTEALQKSSRVSTKLAVHADSVRLLMQKRGHFESFAEFPFFPTAIRSLPLRGMPKETFMDRSRFVKQGKRRDQGQHRGC